MEVLSTYRGAELAEQLAVAREVTLAFNWGVHKIVWHSVRLKKELKLL